MIGDLILRRSMRVPLELRNSPAGELVADKQLVGDRLHFLGIEQHRAAPPFLEFEKPRRLGVDLRIDVVDLFPIGVVGVHRLEIRDEIGAVEDPVAEVAGQRGQPGSAQQPAQIAHRVLAVHAGPIGERRSGQHDRADMSGWMALIIMICQPAWQLPIRHGLPSAFGWRFDDLLDKAGLRFADILDRLTGHRFGQEADKIAGMAGGERDPDLAVMLHAADARAMPGARVEDDKRPLVRVDRCPWAERSAPTRNSPAAACPAVEHQLGIKAQHVRRRAGIVLDAIVAALAQHIQQQN